ncbi:MAG: DUF4174 domain-containing protein [Verrucomicrobiota bacterium]
MSANDSSATLESYRWQKRLLIGAVSEPGVAETLTAEMHKHLEALKERKCLVLIRAGEKWITNESNDLRRYPPNLSEAVLKKIKDYPLALIGLDGGVKSRYHIKEFSWEQVFSEIDSMPMRQREMNGY